MFGFGKSAPVAEHEASDEIDQVYHHIRQTLRVTGVNLIFRNWARHSGMLPVIWNAVQPNSQTLAFEKAADQLRAAAARAVDSLGRLGAADEVALGESQAYQVRGALQLYHYINPKLLLLVAMVRLALDGRPHALQAPAETAAQRIGPGYPRRMYAMEMVDAQPDDKRLQTIFADIQETLSLQSINSDYRTLALWPDYLAAAWAKLKPIVQRDDYDHAAASLRELARTLAAALPFPVALTRDQFEEAGAHFDQAVESAASFERLLPGLILNVAFCLQDWCSSEELACSPFPAQPQAVAAGKTHPHR